MPTKNCAGCEVHTVYIKLSQNIHSFGLKTSCAMPNFLKLTAKDVCAALGVPKHRVRAWTKLQPFRHRPTHARSARHFDTGDLLLMAILQSLEEVHGIRPSSLEKAATALMRFLSQPRGLHAGAIAHLDVSTWEVHSVASKAILRPGLIIDVQRERNRVATFLGFRHVQGELPLGPVAVGQRRQGGSK
jgi:hypothetical protein